MDNLGLNFKEGMKTLIPIPIRGVKMVDWIGALLAPLQTLNDDFATWAGTTRYELKFTGQVVYIEHVLNDSFDNALRRIYITDPSGTFVLTVFLFNAVEQQAQTYYYNKAENSTANPVHRNLSEVFTTADDFIVKIPDSLNVPLTVAQMRKLINRYRAAGKRYSFSNI